MIYEAKIHKLIVRRGFSLAGQKFNKNDKLEATIHGAKVIDGVEVCGLQVGESEPQGIPYEMFTFAD
jgi:hypothetical protein